MHSQSLVLASMQTTHCTTLIPQLFHGSTTAEENLSLHENFAISARLYVITYTILCAAFSKESIVATYPHTMKADAYQVT